MTALAFHFETQPIPTPLAWYAHRLPLWLLKARRWCSWRSRSACPFLILGAAPAASLAFVALVGLQALIALTGNYAFFNLLTAALCLFLLDDAALGSWGAYPDRPRDHEPRTPRAPCRRGDRDGSSLRGRIHDRLWGSTPPGAAAITPLARRLRRSGA